MARLNLLQLLQVAVLCFLCLPVLRCENLLCYFSPILEKNKEKTFELIVTECPPKEVCFKGLGRYGNYTALTARGCMPEERCSRMSNIRVRGTVHTMTYSCCDWQFCNSCSALKPFCIAVILVAVVVMVYGL
ncbi:protein Bouncer-like [Kryptolebias marmoratus]|uniref:protein Bouncer-like n=1 Tax=Kryptolebias marmoratus TaxID=37003 RepID=UPI0018ACAB62|nr:protein Bouncer-like [Kryptolebias marmoratus]